MNKHFILYFYVGSLLISFLYGSSYMLPLYMNTLHGSEINMGWFLLAMGIGALFSTIYLNKVLLRYYSSLTVINYGILAYGLGLLLLAAVTHIFYAYIIGLMMGIGWGLIYVASVITLATNIPAIQRKNHFSYLAAINALGAGLAPVTFQFLNHYISLKQIYFIEGSILSCITISLFVSAKNKICQSTHFINNGVVPIKILFTRKYAISLCAVLIVFLYACIFTTLTFFQIIFADINHVNYAAFFSLLTISIIISRLTLIRWVAAHHNLLLFLSIILTFSIVLFLYIDRYSLIYIVSAVLFGLSYGLIFPIVQTISIANVDSQSQDSVIRYFSLFYFIGIFGFPLISANIIHYLNYKMIITMLIFIATACVLLSVALKTMYKQSLIYDS